MAIGTSEVNAVLRAWANSFVEDVPAIHRGEQYLIEYDTLVAHLNDLSYDDQVQIMLEAQEVLSA